MSNHTLGPWVAGANGVVKSGRYNVCPRVTAGGSSKGMMDEREVIAANTRLIAAAPELLSALKDIIGWVPGAASWHTDAPIKAVERARAAIDKATRAD